MKEFQASIKYFAAYLKKYWMSLIFIFGLMIFSTYLQVKAPTYMAQSITDLGNYLTKYMNPLTRKTADLDNFKSSLWMFMLFVITELIAMLIYSMLQSKVSADSTNRMRIGVFAKMQRMTIKYFDTHQDGKILSLFTSDLDNIFNAMNQGIFQLFANSFTFIGVIIMMFHQNVKLALVTVALSPIVIVVIIFIISKARKYVDSQQEDISSLNGYINEQINGEKIIIINGLQEESIKGFKEKNEQVRKSTFKGTFYSSLLFPILQGFSLLNLAIVIFAGSWIIINDDINKAVGLGLIAMFVQFSQQFFQPIIQTADSFNMLQLALTGATRLRNIHEQPEEDKVEQGKNISDLNVGVKLQKVAFSYNHGKEILHGIDIDVQKGKMVALVGPTGSGKTTVMNLLNRFYDVDSGSVLIGDDNVKDLNLNNLRDHVGIVLQESLLFSGSIADNIKFGKPEASNKEIISAAKQANIHDYIMSLPEKYETKVSDENSVFSTGQKQLISIARTVLTNPAFLILDEATSNVDTVTEANIQKAMDNVIKGRTSFVIAHRLKTILNADKIVVLKDGKVIEEGTHEVLLKENGFYAELYHNQMVFE
ncbi:MAG: ABC transporter ATP-binding protein/permease [Lactobacillaceae bacterium]|jgi:ATP-binding cassette subfamily B multidrug efflux pump|nr:ABC transporter ATP-binding protein/permease [Lactobacillaceae bacterium]